MSEFKVGDKVLPHKDVELSSDNERIMRYMQRYGNFGIIVQDGGDINWKDRPFLVSFGGWNIHFAADDLELVPESKDTP